MNKPKIIYIGKTIWSEEPISIDAITYYSEEYIKETANSLGMDGDAFVARLNGIPYAEFLKGVAE